MSHPPDPPFPGLPPRFELIRKLGAGSTGVVWEAMDKEAGKPVALKVLAGIQPESAACRSMAREARLASQIAHTHIVRVHNFHVAADHPPFIEMELVRGESLSARAAAAGGFLAWEELKPLALQLCDAVAHVHRFGIIHRDIKPSNLLSGDDGMLKLADFGCASLTELSQIDLTQTITVASQGTLGFMSPGQLNGEPPCAADDIYSIGACLHALLAGKPPFHCGYLVHQILTVPAPGIREHQRRLGVHNPAPAPVCRAIQSCLHKDPARRPASAAELRNLLESGVPLVSRRRVLLTTGGAAAVAALGVGAWKRFVPPPVPPDTAAGSPPVARKSPATEIADLEVRAAVPLQGGRMLLGGNFTRIHGIERRALARLLPDGSLDETFRPDVTGMVHAIVILPDQRILLAGSFPYPERGRAGYLKLLNADGSAVNDFTLDADHNVLSMAIDAEGRVLLAGRFVELGGQPRKRIARLTPDLRLDETFSPVASSNVYALLPLADGRVAIGGAFTSINGTECSYLARLHADGRLDETMRGRPADEVTCLVSEYDGSLLVGGRFTWFNNLPCGRLVRMRADGRIDAGFLPQSSATVLSMVPQHHGGLLVSGKYAAADGATSLVAGFNPGGERNRSVHVESGETRLLYSLALSTTGTIHAGGCSTMLDGLEKRRSDSGEGSPGSSLVRLSDGSILWPAEGWSPRLHFVMYELSTDSGNTWSSLAPGQPSPEGWLLRTRALPKSAVVRARGRLTAGIHNGSSSLIEATMVIP